MKNVRLLAVLTLLAMSSSLFAREKFNYKRCMNAHKYTANDCLKFKKNQEKRSKNNGLQETDGSNKGTRKAFQESNKRKAF